MYFGVTADYDSSNDIDILTAGVEAGTAQLLELIGAGSPARTS
jgi:hypothetical protein